MAKDLIVKVVVDSTSFQKGLGKAERSVKSFGVSTKGLRSSMVGLGATLGLTLGAFDALRATVHAATSEFSENQKVAAQTAAAIKSTGGVAAVSAAHIDALGQSLSNLSGIDDEAVRSAENVLLSFTNIRNVAGKNNQIFDEATKAVVNYASRTGRDAAQAAVLFGKALQEPAKRVGILARAGVVLTNSQIKYLRSLEKTQGILGAQRYLIEQLTIRFGGAAKAAGETLPGKLNILRDRFKDLVGGGVGLVSPALSRAAGALAAFEIKLTDAQGASAKFHLAAAGLGHLVEAFTAKVRSINWTEVGATIADKIGEAIKNANWKVILKDAFLVMAELLVVIPIELGYGAGREIAKAIGRGLKAGFTAVFAIMERLALRLALKIIEPFTHLPGAAGRPARRLKDIWQANLRAIADTAVRTGQIIRASTSGADTPGPHNVPAGLFTRGAAPPSGGGGGTAAAAAALKGFALPVRLQIEEARAAASRIQAQIVQAARDIRAFLLRIIPKLKGQKLIDALGLLASANATIADAQTAAADKMKAAAAKMAARVKADSDKLAAAVSAAQANFASQLDKVRSVIGDLFAGPVLNPSTAALKARLGVRNQAVDPSAILADIKAQTAQAALFFADLAKLRKLGGGRLAGAIQGQGLAALPQLQAILAAPAGLRNKIIASYNAQQKFAVRVAAMSVQAQRVVFQTRQPVVVYVTLDGKVVARSVTGRQQHAAARNTTQRRGRHAGANATA